MTTNTYKEKKENYLKKYFSYSNDLEKAIKKAEVNRFNIENYNIKVFDDLKRFDSLDELVKLIDKHKFHQKYNFSYLYKNIYEIKDYCNLYFDDEGLHIHFELINIIDIKDINNNVEMTEDIYNFFHEKRKIILSSFLSGALLDKYKDEDFVVLLTDNKLKSNFIDF